MTPAELVSLVNVYRRTYSNIPQLWSALDFVIPVIAGSGGKQRLPGGIEVRHGCVILPNGMPITYAGLHKTNANVGWTYKYGKETRTLWGGKLTENIVQALARIVVMQNMLEIQQALGLYPVLQVHDELDYVVPAGQAEHYAAKITEIMSRPPQWAKDLPVAVEVHWGPTFGDCK
jgi:DNA polymerase